MAINLTKSTEDQCTKTRKELLKEIKTEMREGPATFPARKAQGPSDISPQIDLQSQGNPK